MTSPNWNALRGLTGKTLRDAVFSTLQSVALDIQRSEHPESPEIVSAVPRLADIIQHNDELSDFRQILNSLARAVGLWNYIDKETADPRDRVLSEAVWVPELRITLHREQVAALNALLSGRNLILSAPTSFGKSALVDALLLTRKYRRVAIIFADSCPA